MMRHHKPIIFILAALSLLPTGAQASTITVGKVSAVYAYEGKDLVDADGTRTAAPSCSSSNWAFDLTTLAGQAKYATAMAAYLSKSSITILGSGSCPDWGDRETISEISLVSPP